MKSGGTQSLTITNSMYNNWEKCEKLYYWRNVEWLAPKRIDIPFLIGNVVHDGLEVWRNGKDMDKIKLDIAIYLDKLMAEEQNENIMDDLLKSKAQIMGMLTAYSIKYSRDEFKEGHKTEQVFHMELDDDIVVAGKIDQRGVEREKLWLREYKTTGETDINKYMNKLLVDGQATMYIWGAQECLGEEIVGVIYDIFRKTLLRQGKMENIQAYCNRVERDYSVRPDFYIHRKRIYRNPVHLECYKRDILEAVKGMREKKHFTHNRQQCLLFSKCSYWPLCWGNQETVEDTKKELFVTKMPNEELHNVGK